jgi:hypothetical protein
LTQQQSEQWVFHGGKTNQTLRVPHHGYNDGIFVRFGCVSAR